MSAVATAAPRQLDRLGDLHVSGADGDPRPSAHRSDGDRLTLEQRLALAWEGLRAAGAADCPVCESTRIGRDGRCGACGSVLY
jgi:hypothetical protein